MTSQITRSEKAIVGSGYLIGFFSDIEVLIANASNYINNISRMKMKYGKITGKTEVDDSDSVLLNIVENVKGSVFRTYIKFSALKRKIKEFQSFDKNTKDHSTITQMYIKIRDSGIPEVDEIENYVLRLNDLFVEAIDILINAQGVYQSLVSGPPEVVQ